MPAIVPNPTEMPRAYLSRGWAVIPIPCRHKAPLIPDWTNLRVTTDSVYEYFSDPCNIGILLGEPSDWLVDVDLDCPEAVELADEYLPPTGAITGRGERPRSHRWYRCEGAQTKKFQDPIDRSMIVEIRSTGAQTVVGPGTHPSGDIYEPLLGDPADVDAEALQTAVRHLMEAVLRRRGHCPEKRPERPDQISPKPQFLSTTIGHITIGERLRRARQYVARVPGAVSGCGGHNITFRVANVLVHGFALDRNDALNVLRDDFNRRCEPPWTEKELMHKVDDAMEAAQERPYGHLLAGSDPAPSATERSESSPRSRKPTETGVPDELLSVPGFVNEVMDHCLATAPYPNRALAFCGAIALQAFLAGRLIRDEADNRTNLYLLGLAYSAGGKDWPRKLNAKILAAVNLVDRLGDQLASGEGLQDALKQTPSMLYQTDEFDAMLRAMNDARDGRYESIMAALLTLHSASNSVVPMRRKAGKPSPGFIDQPSLVIFGTAIPTTFYGALSERTLTNGLFARTLIVESGPRSNGQDPGLIDPSERVIETASCWAASSNAGTPRTVPSTTNAADALRGFRAVADAEYARAEEASDPIATTVWGRACEHVRKLALIQAISADHHSPVISAEGVHWASAFVKFQVDRMLEMAALHAASGMFDELALKAIRYIRKANGGIARSDLLRKLRVKASQFDEIIDTLVEREDIVTWSKSGNGRTGAWYGLPERKEGEISVKEAPP